MPLRLNQIQKFEESKDVVLDFGDVGTIEMTIIPNKYNIGLQRKIKAAIRDNDIAGLADNFFSVVKNWNLTDDEGEPLPLNEEGIDTLKLETVTEIMKKMNEAVNGPKAETSSESPTPTPIQTSTSATSS